MTTYGIISDSGIEEIVSQSTAPQILFGLNQIPSQKQERKAIGHALLKTGLEVHATDVPWPNDAYIQNNGLVIAERDHQELGHGGNYIFGDGFVLVSTSIQDKLEVKLSHSQEFRDFFQGSDIIYVPPQKTDLHGIDGSKLRPHHLDLTIGYDPSRKVLFIDQTHYEQEKALFNELSTTYGVTVQPVEDNQYAGNFTMLQDNGEHIAVVNSGSNPLRSGEGLRVYPTSRAIENLPGKFAGSVKCTVNTGTPELWDALGIKHKRWGVKPKASATSSR